MDRSTAGLAAELTDARHPLDTFTLLTGGNHRLALKLAAAHQAPRTPQLLLDARRAGRLVGAVWGQAIPGRLGAVWPAQLAAGELEATRGKLYAAVHQRLQQFPVQLAQAVLPSASARDSRALLDAGYQHAADLVCLVSLVVPPPARQAAIDCRWQEVVPHELDRLAPLVGRTYAETLDCPTLNGLRKPHDVLRSYLYHEGPDVAPRWLILKRGGHDVGCLLLADHRRREEVELVYLGVVPEARGQQLGVELLRKAQRLAHQAGRHRLLAAVDERNWPALAVYRQAGFTAYERRTAFVRQL